MDTKDLIHCAVSYELTRIYLGGDPEDRPSFWKAYAEMLAHNQKTGYQNARIRTCWSQLEALGLVSSAPEIASNSFSFGQPLKKAPSLPNAEIDAF